LVEECKKNISETTVGIIYLLWLGLNCEEISMIKVSDFDANTNRLTIGNKYITIHYSEISELLVKLNNRALKSGCKKIMISENGKDFDNENYNALIDRLFTNFNRYGGEKKEFNISKIYKSGLYFRIYSIQTTKGYGDSIKDISTIYQYELKEEKDERERDIYLVWKSWKDATIEDLIHKDIDKILSTIETLRKDIFQEDYWSIVKSRIGQSFFREALIKSNTCKCAICNINIKEVLVASHIKEFSECENEERYDIRNGLLFCANHDKLFDRHIISFDEDGKIMISKSLNKNKIKSLGLDKNICIKSNYDEYYMRNYHRKKFLELNKD
jgi:hypothetical protein